MLVSRVSGLGLSPGREHCFVFLGKTLNSHSASLHPGVTLQWTRSKRSRGDRVQTLPVASCYRNWNKLWPNWPLGLCTDFTF